MLDINRLLAAADVAKWILSERILTFVALMMAFSLYAYAMYYQSTLAIWVAGLFSVIVFLPVLVGDRKQRQEQKEVLSDGESD